MIIKKKVVIKNKQGRHARPAAIFVQVANKFDSDIVVTKGKQKVNGKSIMGIMMLAAECNSVVYITASGDDAYEAVEELQMLLSGGLDDYNGKTKEK
jgi:phosphocarrier protein